jgi:hypothetical protein
MHSLLSDYRAEEPMNFDQIRQLALALLQQYEHAWQENEALRTILETYPMPDGTRGIPQWRETLADWLSHDEAKVRAHARFAPLFESIAAAQEEAEVLELLRKFPPVGGLN